MTLANQVPADITRADLIFGVCDRLFDHGHCVSDVVLVPADADGRPDYERADPANVEALPADEWPANDMDADRAAVIVSHVDGCSEDASFLVYLVDNQPQILKIHGPDDDRVIGESIIARDIGARPVQPPPSKLAESFAKLVDDVRQPSAEVSPMMPALAAIADKFERRHEAANDNDPKHDEQLIPYMQAFGGTIRGTSLFGASYNGRGGQIWLMNGKAVFWTDKGAESISLPQKPKGLTIVDPSDWHGQPLPDREWFLPELIPARNVTLLSGDGGVGKSLMALQIGAAAALGIETLGLVPRAGRVFYLGAEDEADEFQRRLAQIVAGHGRTLADLAGTFRLSPMAGEDATLALPDRGKNMQPTAIMESLVEQVTAYRPDLLILDTSADLFGGDEINRVQVRQFVGMLRKIAISIDCAILLLSHPSLSGLQSGSGLSGSTAWNNSVRSRLYLTAVADDDDARVLTTVKSNYGKKGGGMKVRWQGGTFIIDDGKPSAGNALLAARAEGVFCKLLSMLNRQGRNVCHVPGTTYAPAVMAKLPESEGVGKSRLVDAMNSLLTRGEIKISVDGPASRKRQRLILASEDFGPEEPE